MRRQAILNNLFCRPIKALVYQVVSLPSFKKAAFELEFDGFGSRDVWVALLTFLYVDFLDTTGTLFSMATYLGHYIPGNLLHCQKRNLQSETVSNHHSHLGPT